VPEVIRLTRDLTLPIVEPTWPAGVMLLPFSASVAPQVHALMLRAYAAGFGSVPPDFDTWWAATRHDPEFDAGLCFIAAAGDRPVGFALCWTTAFIKDLVVDPDWQGRSIGSAVLCTALRALAARGHAEAALKVHADNVRARRLYAAAGFR
jgi:ribosomal protein S18 acetylase RimI-like enzyme